jgi:hypothetical protein
MRLSQYSINDAKNQHDSLWRNHVAPLSIGLARTTPDNSFGSKRVSDLGEGAGLFKRF